MTVSIPKIENIGDVYLINWGIEKIRMKIDRLHDRNDGVTAEILVTKDSGHVHHGRFNLLSSSSKATLIKSLQARINSVDWNTMLEQACIKTLEIHRTGEPILQLGKLPARETPRYRLYPYILEGERQIFYGYGGQGKSKMSQIMATVVQTGESVLNLKPEKGNVLILDWESSASSVDEFIKAFKSGMELESEELPYYRFCTRSLIDDIDIIQKLILDNGIELLLVDSFGIASGGDSESQEVATAFFRALRSLKISTVIIDHKAKKGKGIYGSIYKENLARSTFEFRGAQSPGSSILNIGLYHRKANDIPKVLPRGYKLDFIGDEDFINELIVAQQDVADIPEIDSGASQRKQVIDLLGDGAKDVKEISEAIDLPDNQIRSILSRGKKTFVKTEGLKWGLLSDYEM